jgi:23S rRNA-/tRNA-specific pseudouridylate synthase
VVYENDQMAVVDKPALLDSQNSRGDRDSVVGWLERRYGFSGLVHRLDFGTSGLMVCAKNAAAARALTASMQAGRIQRSYLALVMGKILPDEGEIATPLIHESGKSEAAVSRYRVRERFTNATLLEVDLVTGRKHQIRRHFSGSGHPLLGDQLYKKRGSDRLFHRPALHAFKLVVDGTEYRRDPPPDFRALLERLRRTGS